MFFLPFRAKNPPEHFPFVTLALIAINVIIFALTSDYLLQIRLQVVEDYALSHNTLSPIRLISAMFLHGSLLHLAGNMLFLWIFGAPLEGRLRPLKFSLIYLTAGIAGFLLHDIVIGAAHPDQPALGASGAIMGVAGAYLFVFPYSTISVLYLLFVRAGVAELQARWVVLLYVGMDAAYAFLLPGGDGVAHFAHLGGFGVGLLAVVLLQTRRDSQIVSAVQAVHAEVKDYSLLSLNELAVLIRQPKQDLQLVMAYCDKALNAYNTHPEYCLPVLNNHIRELVEQVDPVWLAQTLLMIPPSFGGVAPVFYLRIGSRLEALGSYDLAAGIYRRVYDLNPSSPDTEMALYRTALLMQNVYHNREYAYLTYQELLRLFPNGPMSLDARRALQQNAGSRQ